MCLCNYQNTEVTENDEFLYKYHVLKLLTIIAYDSYIAYLCKNKRTGLLTVKYSRHGSTY